MSALPSEDGLFKVVSEAVVGFLFEQVYDLALDGLNHQNVLSCLGLSAVPDPLNPAAVHLAVELEHCFGLSGGFKAAQASVLFVKPIKRADMA